MPLEISNDDIIQALKQTHMHVIGSSGYGKSKFLEWLMHRLTTRVNPIGFALFDWHGTLYDDVLKYLATIHYVDTPVYLLDPSHSDFITGFNPFSSTDGDMSAQVSRRIDATVKPWGATSTDETPLLSRMLRLLYSFAAATNETVPNAHLLFYPANQNIRQRAAELFKDKDDYIRHQLIDLADLKPNEIRTQAASSVNRLDRFLAPTAVRRMLGRADPKENISIRQILDENGILLVNLAASDHLTNESGKLIAALLMNEFREAALDRAKRPHKRYVLFLDEFQEYVTHDIAQMLDQVRKGGLNLVLSHQHFAQLGEDESLQSSIATNARVKAVFGGLDYESAAMVANEIRLKSINRRQVEQQIYGHAVLGHYIQTMVNNGRAESESESWSSGENDSEAGTFADHDPTNWSEAKTSQAGGGRNVANTATETKILVPIDGKELKSEQAKSLEQKIAAEAFDIMTMKPREMYLKLPQWKEAKWRLVPNVPAEDPDEEELSAYVAEICERTHARSPQEIDRLMLESRNAFFEKMEPPLPPDPPAEGRAKKSPRPRSN